MPLPSEFEALTGVCAVVGLSQVATDGRIDRAEFVGAGEREREREITRERERERERERDKEREREREREG
jgi:hypothetical protein